MDLKEHIVRLGTEAILRYRTVSSVAQDNEIPEVFLGSFAAPRLHDALACPVRVEELYSAIAINQKVAMTRELIDLFGGHRADLAVFPRESPWVIIEFKIFDERCPPATVAGDVQKIKNLADRCKVQGYVGVMICETPKVKLKSRIERLKNALGGEVYTGQIQKSANLKWRWCFGCLFLPGLTRVD